METGQLLQKDAIDLPTFLSSINASCSLSFGDSKSAGEGADTNDGPPAPELPLSATVALIDAKIDQLQSRVVSTIRENSDAFKRQAASPGRARAYLDQLWSSVVHTDSQLGKIPEEVSPTLLSYHQAAADAANQDLLTDFLAALVEATERLEQAEDLLANGHLAQLDQLVGPLTTAAALVGAYGQVDPAETAEGTSDSFKLLVQDLRRSNPAVQELARRVAAVEASTTNAIESVWRGALRIEPETPTPTLTKFTIFAQTRRDKARLAEVVPILRRRKTLEPLVKSRAKSLLDAAFLPVLSQWNGQDLFSAVAELDEESLFSIEPAWGDDAQPPLQVLSSLLSFLRSHLFDGMKEDDRQLVLQIFSRELIPVLVPQCIAYLHADLPLSTEPLDQALHLVQDRAQAARALENTLRRLGFAAPTRAPEEDEDEDNNAYALERWAKDAGLHFSRGLSRHALEKARRLILAEGGGSVAGSTAAFGLGWESETIQVESQSGSTQSDHAEVNEVEGLLQSSFQAASSSRHATASTPQAQGAAAATLTAPGRSKEASWDELDDSAWTNGIGGRSSVPMDLSRSTSSAGSGRSTPLKDSPSSGAARKTKAKLGGVRVIRPQDQLGSGPFNENDAAIDEASWGLDDDGDLDGTAATQVSAQEVAVNQPRSTSSASSSRFAPQLDAEVEDDPWFADDSLAEVSAAAETSPQGSSSLPPTLNATPNPTASTATSVSQAGTAFQPQALYDEDAEDAWGLTEDEIMERRASMLLDPARVDLNAALAAQGQSEADTKQAQSLPEVVEEGQKEEVRDEQKDIDDSNEARNEALPPVSLKALETRDLSSSEPGTVEDSGTGEAWEFDDDDKDQIGNEAQEPTAAENSRTAALTMPAETGTEVSLTHAEATASAPHEAESANSKPDHRTSLPSQSDAVDGWGLDEDDLSDEAIGQALVADPSPSSKAAFGEETQTGHNARSSSDDYQEVKAAVTLTEEAEAGAKIGAVTEPSDPDAPSDADLEAMISAAKEELVRSNPDSTLGSDQAAIPASNLTENGRLEQQTLSASRSKRVSVFGGSEAWGWEDDDDNDDPVSSVAIQPTVPARPGSAASSTKSSTAERGRTSTELLTDVKATRTRTESTRSVASPAQRQAALRSASTAAGAVGTVQKGSSAMSRTSSSSSQQRPTSSGSPATVNSRSSRAPTQPVKSEVGGLEAMSKAPESASTQPLKEVCCISKRSVELLRLANELLDDGLGLIEREVGGNSGDIKLSPDVVLGSVNEMFELHRALMPVAHGQVLREVPSLAMQFFNDCEYLSRELEAIVKDRTQALYKAYGSSTGADASKEVLNKLQQQAELTKALGQRSFEAQMASQMKVLLDALNEADGFVRTHDATRQARCERSIKQVSLTLNQLGQAWKPVLAPSVYLTTMGRLVETVLLKVLHDIEDLEDIGETESERLAGLVKLFGSLEELFVEPSKGQTAVALFVPSWFKASYLIEILTGSLVDIEFLVFEAGALVDYTRKELIGLIKALFADTANRAKLIDRIETSGPGVLAG